MIAPVARLVLAAVVVVTVGACADEATSTATTTTSAGSTTTTAAPPIVLGTVRALDLEVGQCYTPVPAVEEPPGTAATTTTATTAPAGPGTGSDTEVPTTAPTTTALPATTAVPPVLVADCGGTHLARVFAAFCLVSGQDRLLEAGRCPGPVDEPWPGDREVRRAATRLCLEVFEQHFGEPYATSRRSTRELTPTEGAWRTGDHRVVCAASEPEPDPSSTTTSAD